MEELEKTRKKKRPTKDKDGEFKPKVKKVAAPRTPKTPKPKTPRPKKVAQTEKKVKVSTPKRNKILNRLVRFLVCYS